METTYVRTRRDTNAKTSKHVDPRSPAFANAHRQNTSTVVMEAPYRVLLNFPQPPARELNRYVIRAPVAPNIYDGA